MPPLWPILGLALANGVAEGSAPGLIEGFDRLHADPETLHVEPAEPELPVHTAALVVHNGHTARASVRVGDTEVGELLPQADGVLREVTAGVYTVRFSLPGGIVRTEQIATRSPEEPDAEP